MVFCIVIRDLAPNDKTELTLSYFISLLFFTVITVFSYLLLKILKDESILEPLSMPSPFVEAVFQFWHIMVLLKFFLWKRCKAR